VTFDDLVAEAAAAPIQGWDFSWLKGRATEERPSWHYAKLLAERAARSSYVLDLQSGGGELLAGLPTRPPFLVAVEGYPPNVEVITRRLRPLGTHVVAADSNSPSLPFVDASFELVTSRHPVATCWDDIARVLRPGGTYLSQQVGLRTVSELREFMMGTLPTGSARDPEAARAAAEAAGLSVVDLRVGRPKTVFYDVGAVVFFLRLVVWTVPDFTVERYRERLEAMHALIEREGCFATFASRFLIEAVKMG
jgi:SAM-dependent methyltransferase